MIAMVILAVALLSLAGLQMVTARGNSLATQITEATTLAQDRLEQLVATPFGAMASGGPNSVTGQTGVVYNVQWTVTPDAGGNRSDVNVMVSWQHDIPHSVSFDSVISQF
jgi:Tfp pilus assembly protein PilV